jgi:beta-N-acetylhexosaminidase
VNPSLTIQQAIGQKLLLAFKGKDKPSDEIIHALREYKASGITLFRSFNIDNPSQLRYLTDQLQRLARTLDLPPFLIAVDQEGGQLMAVGGGTTHLPGNMALGATRSAELARKAGEVLGRELSAMGINVNYAPCVDVNINPQNPVVGIRSFGENPDVVADLASAMIEGIQSQGVAATAKHFPGHGDTASDSHHGLPSVPHSLERLQAVELPPFQAAIRVDVKLTMSAHLALPALDGPDAPPATLSRNILTGLLRKKLGFEGVIVTDAMDMHAIRQGEFLGEDALKAVNAGADLLLLTTDPNDQKRVYEALLQAAQNNLLNIGEVNSSANRILALKGWLPKQSAFDLSVVGCSEHQKIADEIAERSITLVRDRANLLPLRLGSNQRIAVIIPKPQDLTPADTSSYVLPALAKSLHAYHSKVDEFVIPYAPTESDISALLLQLKNYDLILLGTLNAHNQIGQQTLAHEILKTKIPTIIVAFRLPYDLAAFPEAPTYLCTYSNLEPSMRALAKAVFGHGEIKGHLPVAIPGLYEAGYHQVR